jgi:hypothetical protein
VQAQYSYAFVERVLGIAPNRSNLEAQIGYVLTPRIALIATGQWMYTHSGLDLNYYLYQAGLSDDQVDSPRPDRQVESSGSGRGTSLAITPSWQMFLAMARSIEGRNAHLHAAVVTIGVSRSFGMRSRVEKASLRPGGEPVPEANRPLVCTCSKTK